MPFSPSLYLGLFKYLYMTTSDSARALHPTFQSTLSNNSSSTKTEPRSVGDLSSDSPPNSNLLFVMLTEVQAARVDDLSTFDPKTKQKAIYMWYDRRYSDEALDIYSKEWQERIREWYHAYQLIVDKSNNSLNSDDLLETLDFGNFFSVHPIAAFSLWRVLQACYELDRAICGDTEEVAQWQRMPPFKYLKDEGIQLKWKSALDSLKKNLAGLSLNFGKQTSRLQMYQILVAYEKYEAAFASLQENFQDNGKGESFAPWMQARIEDGIGNRLAATELLKGQECDPKTTDQKELLEISSIEHITEDAVSQTEEASVLQNDDLNMKASMPGRELDRSRNTVKPASNANHDRYNYHQIVTSFKTNLKRLARKFRKHKTAVESSGGR